MYQIRSTSQLTDGYLLKDRNENTKAMSEVCSKLTIKTTEQCRQWRHSGVIFKNFQHCFDVSIVDFEQVHAAWAGVL